MQRFRVVCWQLKQWKNSPCYIRSKLYCIPCQVNSIEIHLPVLRFKHINRKRGIVLVICVNCWLSLLVTLINTPGIYKVTSVVKHIIMENLHTHDKNDYICNRKKPSVVYFFWKVRSSEDAFLKSIMLVFVYLNFLSCSTVVVTSYWNIWLNQ